MYAQVAPRFDPRVDVLMTPRPIPIASKAPIGVAATLMRTCHIRHLPVVDDAALVGLLSLRDVIAASDNVHVADVMTSPPRTIESWQPLTTACKRMLEQRLSCLPVVGGGGELAGILTATDALRFAVTVLEDEERVLGRAPRASDLMTPRPLVTVDPNAPLSSAWRMMSDAGVRHLPVLLDGAIAGMLSDRDVLAASPRAVLVSEAMSPRVSTVSVDGRAIDAAHVLLRRRVGALPVLRGRELRGMLTVSDFMYFILSRA